MKFETLNFLDHFEILLEKRLSGVAGLRYIMVYGKSQINKQLTHREMSDDASSVHCDIDNTTVSQYII